MVSYPERFMVLAGINRWKEFPRSEFIIRTIVDFGLDKFGKAENPSHLHDGNGSGACIAESGVVQ